MLICFSYWQSNHIIYKIKYTKRLATFAPSIVENLCLLQQYKWNTNKIRFVRLIINAPYGSSFLTVSWLFHHSLKKLAVIQKLFGSWGHALVAIAVVEKWPLWKGGRLRRFDRITLIMHTLTNQTFKSNFLIFLTGARLCGQKSSRDCRNTKKEKTWKIGFISRGILLAILGGGVSPGSPNPDPISDQKCNFPHPFSDLAIRQKLCCRYLD